MNKDQAMHTLMVLRTRLLGTTQNPVNLHMSRAENEDVIKAIDVFSIHLDLETGLDCGALNKAEQESDNQSLKVELLAITDGALQNAKEAYDWVTGTTQPAKGATLSKVVHQLHVQIDGDGNMSKDIESLAYGTALRIALRPLHVIAQRDAMKAYPGESVGVFVVDVLAISKAAKACGY